MSNIILFGADAKLPAYMANKTALSAINRDVVGQGASFPVLSIKGKVFTLVRDNEKKVLMRDDDPDEVLQNITLTVIRANTKSRVFYAKAYVEGESDGAKPTCFSNDGAVPDAMALDKQAAKCALCPHAIWGSKDGTKGTECSTNTRLAVADPAHVDDPFLLRVPGASRKGFAAAVKAAETRGIPYNALVLKVGFDKEAPSPKLTFKLTGLLDDATYARVSALYDDETVHEIVGMAKAAEETPAPLTPADMDELDAAIVAKAAVAKASKPAPVKAPPPVTAPPDDDDDDDEVEDAAVKPAPVKAAAPKAPVKAPPVKAPSVKAAAPKAGGDMDDLLGDLDALLGNMDD